MKKYLLFLVLLSIIACNSSSNNANLTWKEKTVKNNYGATISYFQFIDKDTRYTYREVENSGNSFCLINKEFVYQVAYIYDEYIVKKSKNKTGNIDDDLIPAGELIKEDLSVLLELEKMEVKDKLNKVESVISTKALELITEAENNI